VRTRLAWARVRVSERVPVATVVLEGHGHVRWCCGDVGSSVAQQGDEGSSRTVGAHEVTVVTFFVLLRRGLERAKAGDGRGR
jgi:hypothetical protein